MDAKAAVAGIAVGIPALAGVNAAFDAGHEVTPASLDKIVATAEFKQQGTRISEGARSLGLEKSLGAIQEAINLGGFSKTELQKMSVHFVRADDGYGVGNDRTYAQLEIETPRGPLALNFRVIDDGERPHRYNMDLSENVKIRDGVIVSPRPFDDQFRTEINEVVVPKNLVATARDVLKVTNADTSTEPRAVTVANGYTVESGINNEQNPSKAREARDAALEVAAVEGGIAAFLAAGYMYMESAARSKETSPYVAPKGAIGD